MISVKLKLRTIWDGNHNVETVSSFRFMWNTCGLLSHSLVILFRNTIRPTRGLLSTYFVDTLKFRISFILYEYFCLVMYAFAHWYTIYC